jgi:hypothetical protein
MLGDEEDDRVAVADELEQDLLPLLAIGQIAAVDVDREAVGLQRPRGWRTPRPCANRR